MDLRAFFAQVHAADAVVYHVDKVRRPIPEDKAIKRAVDMIKVRDQACMLSMC